MFLIALKWLFGGSLLSTVALIAATGAFGTVGGYIKGRLDCATASQLATLRSENAGLKRQLEDRDWLDEFSREQAAESAKIEDKNTVTDRVVQDAIDRAPIVDNCATADFLDRLRHYQ